MMAPAPVPAPGTREAAAAAAVAGVILISQLSPHMTSDNSRHLPSLFSSPGDSFRMSETGADSGDSRSQGDREEAELQGP